MIVPSGDKPLFQALQLMNDEGVSSLPVLDHQSNVIGNISTVDVKVRMINRSFFLLEAVLMIAASDQVLIATAVARYLYPLHFRHFILSRAGGRQGLVPGVLCHTQLDSGTHGSEDGSDAIASVRLGHGLETLEGARFAD